VLGSVAFNLMLALIFALSALGAYGVVYNLLAVWRKRKASTGPVQASGDSSQPARINRALAFLGPFFLLIVSNFEGFLEILHRNGLFWNFNPDGTATSAFWKWLDIKDLSQASLPPLGGLPTRNWWWWRASRVIQDYDLSGTWREIIDEFPFFSYLLGDLHPHVLAMPFNLLAVGVALNLFMGGWDGEFNLFGLRLPVNKTGFFFCGLVIGGLAFMNIWDILFGFALIVGAFVLKAVIKNGWTWRRLGEALEFGVPLVLLAILLYLPFFIGFSSQAGGILPNLQWPTRGVQLWVFWGTLFLPAIAYLLYLWRGEKRPIAWKWGFGLAAGLVVLFWVVSWLMAGLIDLASPALAQEQLAGVGGQNIGAFFAQATRLRLVYFGGWLTLLGLIGMTLALLIPLAQKTRDGNGPVGGQRDDMGVNRTASGTFVLMLTLLAAGLALVPEFVYLRDQFGWRMNTVFKFYYEAWLALSLAAAFGVAVLLESLRGAWSYVYRAGLVLVLVAAMAYPVMGLMTRTEDFKLPAFNQALASARASHDPAALKTAASVWTLDGAAYMESIYPDDMAAAAWLRSAPQGVVVESVGGGYDDADNLMSTYSGQPSVLNGPDHEAQWRGGYAEQGSRANDIQQLYETRSWDTAKAILDKYNIRYVTVGTIVAQKYHVYEAKFQENLLQVYQQGGVTIYAMP
jgi:YYY domain-containing protein